MRFRFFLFVLAAFLFTLTPAYALAQQPAATQDNLPAGMGGDPVGNVIDLVLVDDPGVVGVGAVLADL